MFREVEQFHPRNGHTFQVIGVCRISTVNQDDASLSDQEALYRTWLKQNVHVPFELHVIAGQGSGESLDRAEYLELVEKITSRQFDLVLCEDLGRICRRVHAHLLCEEALDQGTRVIAINDHVDTGAEGWQNNSFFAVMRHEAYNRDTSKRIRRSLRNRFLQGQVVQTFPYGYIKPHPHASEHDCSVDPAAVAVYEEWFTRLEQGQSYAMIADWLNQMKVPVGPGCRTRTKWGPELVATTTRNPILKGVRERNRKITVRKDRSGKRKTVVAPAEELLQRHCPHLQIIETDRFDRINHQLSLRNSKSRRRLQNGVDPRANVPRKQTRWPGQHLTCGICGRIMVYGGNGSKNQLACQGSQQHLCWNVVGCHSDFAARQIATAVLDEIEAWPDYDAELTSRVRQESDALQHSRREALAELDRRQAKLQREEGNLRRSLRELGPNALVLSEMTNLSQELAELEADRNRLEREQLPAVELPDLEELREMARKQFLSLAVESVEFGLLMRRLIPRIECFPYEALDGGRPVLRASVTLNLAGLTPDFRQASAYGALEALSRKRVVDLFQPPQRIRYREQILDGIQYQGQREVAQSLGVKQPIVTYAIRLTRRMAALEATDPYVPIHQPIERGNRFRRHKHPRFAHTPLPGYESPSFPD